MSLASRSDGALSRYFFGTLAILLLAYLGLLWVSSSPYYSFWPLAGLWAAVGWGGNRLAIIPVVLLVAMGLAMDLISGAPIGCYAAIFLVGYLVASVFRKRATTDPTGLIRFVGDCAAFVAAFLFARWMIGAYLGSVDTREIVGGFLSAIILFFPLRSLFRASRDTRVDA